MDELVATLRLQCVEMDCGNCNTCVKRQAADAIEELSKYVNTIRKLKYEGWYLQQTKYHDGYNAVSTMSLPEPPGEET